MFQIWMPDPSTARRASRLVVTSTAAVGHMVPGTMIFIVRYELSRIWSLLWVHIGDKSGLGRCCRWERTSLRYLIWHSPVSWYPYGSTCITIGCPWGGYWVAWALASAWGSAYSIVGEVGSVGRVLIDLQSWTGNGIADGWWRRSVGHSCWLYISRVLTLALIAVIHLHDDL